MEGQVLSHRLKAEEHLALPMTHIAARVWVSRPDKQAEIYPSAPRRTWYTRAILVKNCESALRPSRCTAPVKRRLRRDRHSIKLDLPAPVSIHQGGDASDFSQQHVPGLRMRALAYSPEGPRITVRSPVSTRPCTSQRKRGTGAFSFCELMK